jgi:hypothetical protein
MHNWHTRVELIEAQIVGGQHLRQHDDLAGVHRNGKRNLNRFPFFTLQARSISVDGFLTGLQSAKTARFHPSAATNKLISAIVFERPLILAQIHYETLVRLELMTNLEANSPEIQPVWFADCSARVVY